ncbi:MAG TPA: FG-GAP-like repeat-containing protein, partial [bacterium]
AWSTSGAMVTLNPNSDFKPGELVQVTAANGIQSTGGIGASPYVWQFRAAVSGGSGTFVDTEQSLGSTASRDVEPGDLDGDGDIDAFVASMDQACRVWKNDGTGMFTDVGQSYGYLGSYDAALGDVDGDGDLDAVVGNNESYVWVLINDGTGIFTDSGQRLGNSNGIYHPALGDLDGDGDLDVFLGDYTGNSSLVFINNGTGTFANSGQSLGGGETGDVAIGDLDGDGDLDAFVVYWNYGTCHVFINDGTGIFTSNGQTLGSIQNSGIVLGDLDGDGDLDAYIVKSGQFVKPPDEVWLNDGTGVFTDSGQSMGNYASEDADLGDVDGDGDLDAFISVWGQGNRVWLNNGSGVFTDSGQSLGNYNSQSAALGDLDGDGDLDAFAANTNQGNRVWKNGGLDFGDAPDPLVATAGQYPTLSNNDGARHIIDNRLKLGTFLDADTDGYPSSLSDGDDNSGTDDEDGVTIPTLTKGGSANIPLSVTNATEKQAYLNAWVDWNHDGDWMDTAEQIAQNQTVANGNNVLAVQVPLGALSGTSTARFRLSTLQDLTPTGLAQDGEVEDYAVSVQNVSVVLNQPNGWEFIRGSAAYVIRWTCNPAGIGTVTLSYSTDAGV